MHENATACTMLILSVFAKPHYFIHITMLFDLLAMIIIMIIINNQTSKACHFFVSALI